jgi:hypothetical protein
MFKLGVALSLSALGLGIGILWLVSWLLVGKTLFDPLGFVYG